METEKKLNFLEDVMDLPTNCFSTFKNRNGDRNCPLGTDEGCETKQVKKIGPRKPIEEDTVTVSLSKVELDHLINDTIDYIYKIKDYAFDGKINKNGVDVDTDDITPVQYHKLIELGYFTREALLNKLRKLREEKFPEYTCAG